MTTPRQHLVPEQVREANLALDRRLRRIDMDLRSWKILKSFFVSIAVVLFGVFAILRGADPGPVAWLTILTLILVNGIEVTELLSVWAELKLEDHKDD